MLQHLPLELILLVIESGRLGIEDAIMLRSTCRPLYEASKQRSYWASVAAVTVDAGHVLLEYPFRPLSSLPAEDLFAVCKSTQRAISNLSSESPRPVSHDTFSTSKSSDLDSVSIFASLSGGSHFITVHLQGVVKIWDVRSPSYGSATLEPEAGLENSDHPVATYRANVSVSDVSYCTTGATGAKVILALLLDSQPERHGTEKIKVIEFELPQSVREIEVQDYVESSGLVGLYTGTLHVQDSLVAALSGTDPDYSLHFNVHDYRRNLMWVITTELDGFDIPWDMFTVGGDWILFREDQKKLTFHAWFDTLHLFAQTSELSGVRQPMTRITRPSDSSRTVEFANSFASGTAVEWNTIHPWSTPNHRTRNLIPASGTARVLGDDDLLGSQRLMYRHDINPAYISHLLRCPEKPIERPHRFDLLLSDVTEPPQPLRSLWITSSCGKRWAWIGQSSQGVLQLATLLFPETPEHSGSRFEHIRRLDVPLDLSKVVEVDFCDESATLVLLTKEDGPGRGHKVHLLRF
ncbi:hypothetical protein M407DRAFT_225286 [Tulasnella calospora MUT 4182]|uniref:F-box domain-containing protein n=1 Tax=Tulasnella calospora MUT 4182 TaxID=1051891 RepID=A0A0C3LAN4_9AGAM|nr:hypothetical protein M407DRAFT_225286 [Tulasnella calospora MUT 4182]